MTKLLLILTTLGFLSSCGGGGGGSTTANLTTSGTLFNDNITIGSTAPTLFFLVGFTNKTISSTAIVWANKVFGTATGQINHYYNEISSGKFQLTPANENQGTVNDGIINVVYQTEQQTKYSTGEAATLIGSVLSASDSVVDYSSFDTNSDGAISRDELQLIFIFAGQEGAFNNGTSGVWAHAICSNNGKTLDGVVVARCDNSGSYAVFGEKHGSIDATIGVIAHELGHSLFNLPDLYDINGVSAGIGNFGLMGGGSWTKKIGENPGETPSHMTTYSKIKSGFLTPITLSANTTSAQVIATSQTNQNAYKIMISNPKEYFLIANRNNSGYDAGMQFGGGLLISHIDENKIGNGIISQKLVDIEEANNAELDFSTSNSGNAKALFYSGNQTDFDSTTTPNSNANNSSTTGISISNISVVGTTMTFDLNL